MSWNEDLMTEKSYLRANLDSGLIEFENDEDEDDGSVKTTRPLVHGMLVSSIFSSIFSTLSPGAVYLNQSLGFASPVFVNEPVVGRVEIERVRRWRRGGVVVECETRVFRLSIGGGGGDDDGDDDRSGVAIKGNANVWLPSGYASEK